MISYSYAQVLPLSDQPNLGDWELNTTISDEFNNGSIDIVKWQIQGQDNIYKSNFIGRAPSQFNPNNAIVEDNKLKILTKWEPSFPFSTTPQDGVAYENITTAAVISKEQFHYGYMEIRSKAAKAEITSSFWTTGFESELDMFEMFGDTDTGQANINWRKRLKFNTISWDPSSPYYQQSGNGPVHTRDIQADDNTADDFHVYGFDWTSEYIKVYIDGTLHPNGTILRSQLSEDRWVTNVPYWIWFDSETFPWLGIPEEADLMTPAEYQIDYIRVWEKKNDINSDFFGFESSINIDGIDKDWYIDNEATDYLSISSEKPYRWSNSLKFTHNGTLANNAVIFSPLKSVVLDASNYVVSFKVWLAPSSSINNVQVVLDNPSNIMNFDVSGIETGKWVTLSKEFTTNIASGNNARLRIRIRPTDANNGTSTMYIDDIFINSINTLAVEDFNNNKVISKIYPNPIDNKITKHINVSSPYAQEIVVYNVAGVKLFSMDKTNEPFKFSVENLNSGLYFISLISNETVETKKLIIK